jgi:hypothetical protein
MFRLARFEANLRRKRYDEKRGFGKCCYSLIRMSHGYRPLDSAIYHPFRNPAFQAAGRGVAKGFDPTIHPSHSFIFNRLEKYTSEAGEKMCLNLWLTM